MVICGTIFIKGTMSSFPVSDINASKAMGSQFWEFFYIAWLKYITSKVLHTIAIFKVRLWFYFFGYKVTWEKEKCLCYASPFWNNSKIYTKLFC